MTSVHRHACVAAVAAVSALFLTLAMVVPGQTAAQAQASTTVQHGRSP